MQTGNQGIRLATAEDAAAIAAIYAPNVTEGVASFEMIPPDAAEMARRMAASADRYPWLVCERQDGVTGYVYASTHNVRDAYQWSANVTVYIDERCRRQNIGRALYTALLALLKLQGFYNAIAGITLPNAGSVGLHEGMGFRLVGVYRNVGHKLGRWHDVGWWSLALREALGAPPEPLLDVSSARKLPGWQVALEAGAALLRPSRR